MIGGNSGMSEYTCSDGRQPKLLRNSSPKKSVVAVVGASYSSVTVQVNKTGIKIFLFIFR